MIGGRTSPKLKSDEATCKGFKNAIDEIVLAYSVQGAMNGPNLLVCGRKKICRPIFARIKRLPTLPWLRGTLHLAYIGPQSEVQHSSKKSVFTDDMLYDGVLFFDLCTDEEAARELHVDRAYWTTLRKMTVIGMISGRGVVTR